MLLDVCGYKKILNQYKHECHPNQNQPHSFVQSENLPILHHGCAIDQLPNVSQEIEVARSI